MLRLTSAEDWYGSRHNSGRSGRFEAYLAGLRSCGRSHWPLWRIAGMVLGDSPLTAGQIMPNVAISPHASAQLYALAAVRIASPAFDIGPMRTMQQDVEFGTPVAPLATGVRRPCGR